MGTPEFARVHLEALLGAGVTPVAVFTREDKPAGRGLDLIVDASHPRVEGGTTNV